VIGLFPDKLSHLCTILLRGILLNIIWLNVVVLLGLSFEGAPTFSKMTLQAALVSGLFTVMFHTILLSVILLNVLELLELIFECTTTFG